MKRNHRDHGSDPMKRLTAPGDAHEPPPTPRIVEKGTTITRTRKGAITVNLVVGLDEMLADLCTPTGTSHDEVAMRIVEQGGNSLHSSSSNPDVRIIQAISTIKGLAPQTLTEAMLATQMIATHEAALLFLRRTTLEGQTVEGADANVLRATRLMRLHLDQIEAMQPPRV